MKPIETLSNLLKQEKNLKKKERIQALFWLKTWLYTVHDLDVAYKVVHDTVYYRLKAKLKVPRRSNIKKDANAEAEFKKRTARAVLKDISKCIPLGTASHKVSPIRGQASA